jgi:hypothetical protein
MDFARALARSAKGNTPIGPGDQVLKNDTLLTDVSRTGCDAQGVDWTTDLATAASGVASALTVVSRNQVPVRRRRCTSRARSSISFECS